MFCREEESLVDRFVFELLVVYVESLALAHGDEAALGRRHFRSRAPRAVTHDSWLFSCILAFKLHI